MMRCLISFFIMFLIAGSFANGQTSIRELRYTPDQEDFVIINGNLKFNRALYGTNTEFRVEAGDLPEFALYFPGMGGNLKFALVNNDKEIWLSEAQHIESRYRPGSMIYKISDPLLGEGILQLTVLAMSDEEGLIAKAEFDGLDAEVKLLVVYGGASNEVFRRAGERNVDAPDCFFLKAENCKDNIYTIDKNFFTLTFGKNPVIAGGSHLVDEFPTQGRKVVGTFPENSVLLLKDANAANAPMDLLNSTEDANLPVICGVMEIEQDESLYFSIHNPQRRQSIREQELASIFATAEEKRSNLASRLVINTPDPFLNTVGGALSVAGDAIWQYPSYLHGAISWRIRIPGWRAAYVADVLGWNDRAKTHFSAYANSQLTAPITGPVEMDSTLNLGRVVKRIGNAMYSSGYICPEPNNPNLGGLSLYDMNLVFIDALIRHIHWTGDIDYLREIWPTIERHLAWEKRTFDADSDGLYDAFASFWASDAFYYNGGGVTYSSAYNYFANKSAAEFAVLLGLDGTPYLEEADKILKAINSTLWLKNLGHYAEFVDAMGLKRTHPSASLWTVYHAIDSEIADPFQRYQTLRYVDNQISHIPFKVKDMEDDSFHVVATTNRMPYYWSVNNVAPAEQMHTALAFWQGGRYDEAYRLLKSVVMDNLYCGSSPGNFSMLSMYNAATRNEGYRDFSDVIGITSRALIEGLIGIQPDASNGRMVIKPGLPQKWDYASFELPYLKFDFNYSAKKSTYIISQRNSELLKIALQIPAKTGEVRSVLVNGKVTAYKILEGNVGFPMIEIELPENAQSQVHISWKSKSIEALPLEINAISGQPFAVRLNAPIIGINDPEGIFTDMKWDGADLHAKKSGTVGAHTFFAKLKQKDMTWWQPIHITIKPLIEIVPGDADDGKSLNFFVRNNSTQRVTGMLNVASNTGNGFSLEVYIPANSSSELVEIPSKHVVLGTNHTSFTTDDGETFLRQLVNWSLPLNDNASFEQVNIDHVFNNKVDRIFAKNKYLSPRSPYNTLQIPTQGVGEWCKPMHMVELSDIGFRAASVDDLFTTPFGLPFATPGDSTRNNIAFSSLWDNYPDSISVPLQGRASHAYLLLAGSTSHMQSRIENGVITIEYADGSIDQLSLINPETWAPIERDYYSDDFSYKMNQPRPYRVVLKTGQVARQFEDVIIGKELDRRYLDGGAAIILDLPLEHSKELKKLTLRTVSNEVVIGLMGVTLDRN